MNKEDINKLLEGRKIIDTSKILKSEIRAKYEKTNYEEMQKQFTSNTENTSLSLAKLGFNSIDEFEVFNKDMVMQAIRECRTVRGTCDKCGGELSPYCVKAFGKDSCYTKTGNMEQEDISEGIYKYIYYLLKHKNAIEEREKSEDGKIYNLENTGSMVVSIKEDKIRVCPEGHGYYLENKPYPFDMTWKV